MATSRTLRVSPAPHPHVVQLYTDSGTLSARVGQFFSEGLRTGGAAISIATPEHTQRFREALEAAGIDAESAHESRKLLLLDAESVLSRCLLNGHPDWSRFETTVSTAVRSLRGEGQPVRAYGEMVGLLWAAGQYSAAIELENCWNRILPLLNVNLFCAYPIDIFGPEFNVDCVHSILCDHTHLLPAEGPGDLEAAILNALKQIEGSEAATSLVSMDNRRPEWGLLPSAECLLLSLREAYPNSAAEIIRRAQQEFLRPTQHC